MKFTTDQLLELAQALEMVKESEKALTGRDRCCLQDVVETLHDLAAARGDGEQVTYLAPKEG